MSEDTAEQATLKEMGRGIIDRRVAVAPMMDWTDDHRSAFQINGLLPSLSACLLYVSSSQAETNPASFSALASNVAVASQPSWRLRASIRQSAKSAAESLQE